MESVQFPLGDLPPGCVKQVKLNGQTLCVANADGEIFAVSDACTHARVPLSDGYLEGRQIVCPWHGAMFDLKTGRPTCGPAVDPLRCYSVRIERDLVTVESVRSE
jgi:3-phenylpropionate/trans-cinnamate dioxygenase ferredoxin component